MNATLQIDLERQLAFAHLAGDYNPLHVDLAAARRSQFGTCVVHGVHLILGALDSTPIQHPFGIERLDAQFRSAVLVGGKVEFVHTDLGDGAWRIDVLQGVQKRATVVIHTVAKSSPVPDRAHAPEWPSSFATTTHIEDLSVTCGTEVLTCDRDLLEQLFPRVAQLVSSSDVDTILGATRVVGMRCPGEMALFRRLEWRPATALSPLNGNTEGQLHYSVSSVDPRYSLVRIAMSTAERDATAEVLFRIPPPAQPTLAAVRASVASDEFEGVRALVIGGARGLGELTAKILVAGGSRVFLTYRSGVADAKRLAAELGHRAEVAQLDVEDPEPAARGLIHSFAPTHLFYFATPPIQKLTSGTWDASAYDRLRAIYANGFAGQLDVASAAGALHSVFLPSTSYIDEAPSGFGEYVAAKVAGEAVASEWQRTHPQQHVVCERLPPLVTDQTAASLGDDTTSNMSIMLPVLRRFIAPFRQRTAIQQ